MHTYIESGCPGIQYTTSNCSDFDPNIILFDQKVVQISASADYLFLQVTPPYRIVFCNDCGCFDKNIKIQLKIFDKVPSQKSEIKENVVPKGVLYKRT